MTVDFLSRAVIVGLASYAVTSTIAALVVRATWRRTLAAGPLPPRWIAGRLFTMRMTPAVTGMSAAIIFVCAFILFEPNRDHEKVGLAVVTCALLGLTVTAVAAARIAALLRASLRLNRQWLGPAAVRIESGPIEILRADTAFPIVALLGCVRPRLIVASRVVDACTEGELEAVIAHEMAHLAARDNLRRTLFAVCPDVLSGSRTERDLERAWAEATELAADDWAARGGARRRLDLASALVKVARLAVGVASPPLPATALFRGEPVADRVRRLLSPPAEPPAGERWGATALAALVALLTILLPASLSRLHELVEAAITIGR